MQRLIAIFLLLSFTSPVYSATSNVSANYEIEVLVFETQLPEYEGSELWTRTTQPTKATPITIETLPPTPDFSSAINAMRTDGRHRVLLHKRWVQSAESKSSGPSVQLATADNELNGSVKFYLSRFLHVELNVGYQPQAGAIGASGTPTVTGANFFISEQRRVKSNDLNYFDHPKFGVLVRVSPAAG